MPGQPTVKYFRITNAGSTYINNPSYLNVSGGPVGVEIGAAVASPNNWIDHGNDLAGRWATPTVLMIEFTDNTASDIRFSVYDAISNLENFFSGTPWDFRVSMPITYTAPADVAQSTMAAWLQLPHGSDAGLSLDSNKPAVGFDGTSALLKARVSNSGTLVSPATGDKFYLNFWLYLSAKPQASAVAGEHVDWGYRTTFVYPGF